MRRPAGLPTLADVRAASEDPRAVAARLREVLECSEDDVAWVRFWLGDEAVLTDAEADRLLTFALERAGDVRRRSAQRGSAWDVEERTFLIERHLADTNAAHEARWAEDADRLAFHEQRRLAWRELVVNATPYLALARCPFTGDVAWHSLDVDGLDGLWWDADSVHRPAERLPATWFALTGAVRLTGRIPVRPWLVVPGPEAPFVLPRLLDAGLVAVLTRVDVAGQAGQAVTYFGESPPDDVEPTNTWGLNSYPRFAPGGAFLGYGQRFDEDSYDYDLAPWLASGRLRWIAPGDPDLVLRQGLDECPYLDLPGRRAVARIRAGEIRWPA